MEPIEGHPPPTGHDRLYRAFLGAAAVLFISTRLLLFTDVGPYVFVDTLKYMGGADTLWQGAGLPPAFTHLAVTGGVLHAVPGYSAFIFLVWWLSAGPSVSEIVIAQAAVSLLGFCAAAHLAAQIGGRWAAPVLLIALSLSPAIAWLEHTLMPDTLVAPLLWIACWLAFRFPTRDSKVLSGSLAGLGTGVIMGAEVLLRASSQAFVPVPPIVAFLRGDGMRRIALWLGCYAVGAGLSLSPWILHNARVHGLYVISASMGRNVFYSAAWSGAIDRGEESLLFVVESEFRRLINQDLSYAEADAKMLEIGLRAYAEQDVGTTLRQRWMAMNQFFTVESLAEIVDGVLRHGMPSSRETHLVEDRFRYRLTPDVRESFLRARVGPSWARPAVRAWWTQLDLSGWPLAILFALGLLGLPLCARPWYALWIFAAPALAFLAVYFAVGVPEYRYQVQLHPFFLATAVIGCAGVLKRIPQLRGRSGKGAP